MPELVITEVAAWALILGGAAFAAVERWGMSMGAGAVAAALVALAKKSFLLGA